MVWRWTRLYATYISNIHVCPRSSKVYGCFHLFSWGCMINRCFCPRSAIQRHGFHQLPCMEFMIGSCTQFMHENHQNVMRCNDGLRVPSTWYETKQTCQTNDEVRHQIEQFLILRSFADFCARFAEFCARFAWPPFHIFSSFTHGSCKLATCSHPVQGHDGAAMLTDEPSNSKPSPMKGLHMFASAHPARPFMIACHDESGTLAWGWCRMYVYTLVTSASARASFKGMLVNSSSSENLNYKPNMSHIVLSIPKQFQKSKSANKWKIMSLEKKVLDFLVVLVLCSFAFFAYQNLIWTRFCVPKEGLGYISNLIYIYTYTCIYKYT